MEITKIVGREILDTKIERSRSHRAICAHEGPGVDLFELTLLLILSENTARGQRRNRNYEKSDDNPLNFHLASPRGRRKLYIDGHDTR